MPLARSSLRMTQKGNGPDKEEVNSELSEAVTFSEAGQVIDILSLKYPSLIDFGQFSHNKF